MSDNDIVKMLRMIQGTSLPIRVWQHHMLRAASEIEQNRIDLEEYRRDVERLRAENERLTADGIHTCHEQCQRYACVLRRERDAALSDVERLKHERQAFKDGSKYDF